jgi:hypothetical protein
LGPFICFLLYAQNRTHDSNADSTHIIGSVYLESERRTVPPSELATYRDQLMGWRRNFLFYAKLLVSLVFFAAGVCKVFPFVHGKAYEYIDDTFRNSFAPVWQKLLFDFIGHRVTPIVFKYFIGNLELAVSVLLWGAGGLPIFACLLGFLILFGAIVTHIMLGESIILPLCLEFLCILIFSLSLKSRRRKKN